MCPVNTKELTDEWIKQKKTTLADYKTHISTKGCKFDELAIFLFALSTKCHVGVLFNGNTFWTTAASCSLDDCKVFLLWKGNLIFEQIQKKIAEQTECDKDDDNCAEKRHCQKSKKRKDRRSRDSK